MTDLSRLREIIRAGRESPRPARELTYVTEEARTRAEPLEVALADIPGARLVDTDAGSCIVVERRVPLDERHGRTRVRDLGVADGPELRRLAAGWSGGGPEAADGDGRLVFLDLETTGLSGGAGTCAFLVGLGFFSDDAFVTRQYFLARFADERAQLLAVARELDSASAIVTFNGKTFDLPVMETRWSFHRMSPPDGTLHLDMLHPARCLWKGRRPEGALGWSLGRPYQEEAPCTLASLERQLLGVARHGDVPGFEIPGRYFQFVRSGQVSLLDPVFEHNRLDLISLAGVTACALRLLEDGPDGLDDPRECLALGRLHERLGEQARANDCYRRVSGLGTTDDPWPRGVPGPVRHEALRRLALSHRRSRQYAAAARCWAAIVEDPQAPQALRIEAAEALAVHHEHRARDLQRARTYAQSALAPASGRRHDALQYRLARLHRKISLRRDGGATSVPPLLP